jgi:IclR family transcriptional regulator, KDG regulon repressor
VSFTMLENTWESKKEAAKNEIVNLAKKLSFLAGYKDASF